MTRRLPTRAAGSIVGLAALACNDLTAVEAARVEAGVWVGNYHTCGQDAALEFRCWGDNIHAQAGQSLDEAFITTPRPVPGVRDVVQAALGTEHSCVLDRDGRVRCWGGNRLGQLGRGGAGPPTTRPGPVVGLRDVVEIGGDGDFVCARRDDRSISCWGANHYGQLGRGFESPFEPTAAPIPGLAETVDLAVGRDRACALDSRGVVRCWGLIATGLRAATPTVIEGLPADIVDVSASFAMCCALTSAGEPWCWEDPWSTTGGPFVYPIEDVRVVTVDAGHQVSCGLDDAGVVHCWLPERFSRSPVTVSLPAPAAVLAKADYFGCALLVDDSLWCWGANDSGQLGDGTTDSRDAPVRVRWDD